MELKELRYITEIAKEQTLSGAARKLGVSQPTLSVFLSDLEKELGTDLFYRDQRKLQPTPAGVVYLNAAKKIIAVHERTYLAIRRLEHTETSTCRIAASPQRGAVLFADLYPIIARRYPDVRLEFNEVYTPEIKKALIEDRADLALMAFVDQSDRRFRYLPTSKEELVVVMPTESTLTLRAQAEQDEGITMDSLRDASFVMMSEDTSIRYAVDKLMRAAHIAPVTVYETLNNNVVLHMVKQGMGIGFLPRSVAEGAEGITCYSLKPHRYFYVGLMKRREKAFTEMERYFAYRAMLRDRRKTYFLDPDTEESKAVMEEFGGLASERG